MIITKELFLDEFSRLSIHERTFVTGLSGGADSLCLTLLMNELAVDRGLTVNACIVDHRLRPESSIEIIPTIEILKRHSINYKVFVWEHPEVSGSIEQKARQARYGFLYGYCHEVGSKVLMTAHHALDQWETFFMRLSRGSALRGLSSIKPVSIRDGIYLVRPLLRFSPWDIRETLANRFGITDYVHDPSNEQSQFERVRWRKSYAILSGDYGLGIDSVNTSIERIQLANDCLEDIAEKLTGSLFNGTYINIKEFKKLHLELRVRVLYQIIGMLSPKGSHIVSYSLAKRVAEDICQSNFSAVNLSGLIFRRDRTKNVKVFQESR